MMPLIENRDWHEFGAQALISDSAMLLLGQNPPSPLLPYFHHNFIVTH